MPGLLCQGCSCSLPHTQAPDEPGCIPPSCLAPGNEAPPTIASTDVDSDDGPAEVRVVLGNPVESVLRSSCGREASPHTLHCLVPTMRGGEGRGGVGEGRGRGGDIIMQRGKG